jgi:prepilin-type N-terminal cleavage/methylation domain-containing protein
MSHHRSGYSLIELVMVIAIISILAAITLPPITELLDHIAVLGAATDAEALFDAARHTAIARSKPVVVAIDTSASTLTVYTGSDTLRQRNEGALHGIHFAASRLTTTYAPTGLGVGTANLTLLITKHNATDTVIISRLGRVR